MTDRERVSKFSEESVERMAMDDPDNFLKTDEDWAQAIIHRPGIRGPQKAPTKKINCDPTIPRCSGKFQIYWCWVAISD